MKTIAICLLAALTLSMNVSANTPNGDDKTNEKLKKELNKHLTFPVFAEENMQGDVLVQMSISKEGAVEVLEVEANNDYLKRYVSDKLSKIKLPLSDQNVGETLMYKFVFRKEKNN